MYMTMDLCHTRFLPLEGQHCPPVNDSLLCWPPTPANRTIYLPCPHFLGLDGSEHRASRTCLPDGSWDGNWTNYNACMMPSDDFIPLAVILKDIYFITSLISLTFLMITLFIFCYFRSLQCSRISIHKQLVLSFIMRFILIIINVQPYTFDTGFSYRDNEVLCKMLIGLRKYAQTANFAWMLVEGIYLHNRLAVCVFTSVAPFKLFSFIGWGVPLLITSLWCGLMEEFHRKECWADYAKTPLIFLIFIPILVALVVNGAFLVNIIRVLVMKLRSNNNLESKRIRKAIKATVVLLPLLGVANLLFLAQPTSNGPVHWAYRVINTVLPSCQGIFVSVLYCFMNSEVQNVIRKKWKRFRVNRAMYRQSGRQGSRTSSFYLSQSDTGAQSRRLNVLSNINSAALVSAAPNSHPLRWEKGKNTPFYQHYMEEEDEEEDGQNEEEDDKKEQVKLNGSRHNVSDSV